MQCRAAQALLCEPGSYSDRDLQSAHAPAAWVIYKPSRYRFNTRLFIIIRRLKAFTLACLPPWSTAVDGVAQPVKATRLFIAEHPLCDPSHRTTAGPGHIRSRLLGLLQPVALMGRNNTEDTSEAVSLSYGIKPNFRPIHCLNIYTSFSITAAACLDFTTAFGFNNYRGRFPFPNPTPAQQHSAITPMTAARGQVTSHPGGATVLPSSSSLPRMELTGS